MTTEVSFFKNVAINAMLRLRRKSQQHAQRAHRDTLLKVLERRMESAREKGDNQLLRQLEAEAQYLN
ncbi:MAG: hypothetical protein EAZ61_12815 [Oscillatoriales cyanobacterium]|jgi:hypothetical protein|nr:MAG: hypothetical protein EAZ61_12815 [Oscillatoriales cyanobacterium]